MKWILFVFFFFLLPIINLKANENYCHNDIILRKEWKKGDVNIKQEKLDSQSIIFFVSVQRNELKVIFKQSVFIESIKIYNLLGELILFKKIDKLIKNEIKYPFVSPNGLYFLDIMTDNEQYSFNILNY